MQIPNYIIAILLGIGAILTAVFSSIYDEKKDKKLIAGIVIGVLVYVAGLGLAGMNSPVGAGALFIGSILISICSYFYNKSVCDDNTSSSKKRGLVAGIIIGVGFITFGMLWSTPKETIEQLANTIDYGKQETSRLASEAASKIVPTAQPAVEPAAPEF